MERSISVLFEKVIYGCFDCGSRHVNYICKFDQNLNLIRGEVETMRRRRNDVLTAVHIEEGKGKKRLDEVAGWINNVESLITEFELLSAGNKRGCSCSIQKNVRTYKLAKSLEMLAEKMVMLKDQTFAIVATQLPPSKVNERPSETLIGATATVNEVWNYLLNDQVSVIGLYGMGGIGKNAILTEINNKLGCTETVFGFDLVIWVTVSKTPNLSDILDCIGYRIGRSDEIWRGRSEHDRALEIFEFLKGRKFVLLLDDIWKKVDLKTIGVPIPTPANQSKLVFTCRSLELCGHMGAQEIVRVKYLSIDDAWNLFSKKVGQHTLNAHQKILELAKLVCEKCDGLPLMLNTLGHSMSSKTAPQEWDHILNRLNRNILREETILSNLELSYDSLTNATIKYCFRYLCFFVSTSDLRMYLKDDLVLQWYASGLLDTLMEETDSFRDVLNRGYTVLGELQSAGLCDVVPNDYTSSVHYKMHNVIIEMGQWVSSKNEDTCKRFQSNPNAEIMQCEDIFSHTERIFLCGSDIMELINPFKCHKLLTLILSDNHNLKTMSDGFFDGMPKLKVLSLSGCGALETLPMRICTLKNLRYLNIWGTSIKTLPERIQELSELRILRLNDCVELSCGIISSFKYLRYFDNSGNASFTNVRLLEEFANLELLKSLAISNLTYSSDSFGSFITSRKLLRCTFHLGLTGQISLTQEIDISFIFDMDCLEYLSIKNFSKLKSVLVESRQVTGKMIRPKWYFPPENIVSVTITDCPALQDISGMLISMPNIECLVLIRCTSLKTLLEKEVSDQYLDGDLRPLAGLQRLTLRHLPSMKYICPKNRFFHFLQSVELFDCPALHMLPFTPSNARKLRTITCEQTWLDGLRWEDEYSPVFFADIFDPVL